LLSPNTSDRALTTFSANTLISKPGGNFIWSIGKSADTEATRNQQTAIKKDNNMLR
jgi:hypothetical protein